MEENISLVEMIQLLRKHLFLILVTSLVGLGCALVFTLFFITPTYTASNQLLVNPITAEDSTTQYNDLQTDIQMISTYKDILKGPVILNEVKNRLATPMTTQQIANKITVETQPNSKVFSIKITDSDPKRAATLANLISDVFQEKIGELMRIDTVNSISSAEVNLNPVSPNKTINIVIGAILGFMAGVAIAFLLEYLNLRVRNEQYLSNTFDLLNLGSVNFIDFEEPTSSVQNKDETYSPRSKKTKK